MHPHDQYVKAVDIADMLLARGYPVRNFEVIDGMMIFRFHGPRAQTIHADADTASLESLQAAYNSSPPPLAQAAPG